MNNNYSSIKTALRTMLVANNKEGKKTNVLITFAVGVTAANYELSVVETDHIEVFSLKGQADGGLIYKIIVPYHAILALSFVVPAE